MKNENSDEKVTPINPVNQSQSLLHVFIWTIARNDLISFFWFKEVWSWNDVNCVQISWLTEIQPPISHFTPSPCIYIWKPVGSIRRSRGLLEWKINGHKHSLWEKQHQGVVLLLPGVRSMSCGVKESTSDIWEWVIGLSPLSTAMSIFCGFQCCWKDLPSQKAVGDANTTYLFLLPGMKY